MNTTRQGIVDKLNTKTKFNITYDELEFIVENWITTHSQHLSTATLRFDSDKGVSVDITLDKESIFKHF